MAGDWKSLLSCALALAATATVGHGQTHKDIGAAEIAQLPPFCWEQYIKGVSGPQYRIGRDCGPATNHYCPGLVELMRAKRSLDARKRLSYLQKAKHQTLYTLKGIERYPACSIRNHVEKTLNEVNALLMGRGEK